MVLTDTEFPDLCFWTCSKNGNIKQQWLKQQWRSREQWIFFAAAVCPQNHSKNRRFHQEQLAPSAATCHHSITCKKVRCIQGHFFKHRESRRDQLESSLVWSGRALSRRQKKVNQQGGCESHAMLCETSNLTMVATFGISTKIGRCLVIAESVSVYIYIH